MKKLPKVVEEPMEILGIQYPLDTERDIRKEIVNRWEALGFADGLSGKINEKLRELFESEAKGLLADSSGQTIEWPVIRRVTKIRDYNNHDDK